MVTAHQSSEQIKDFLTTTTSPDNNKMTFAKDKGEEIAAAWGPALTKGMNEGDMTAFKALFIDKEPIYTVLQDSVGNESETSIGEGGEMSWETFQELSSKDLAEQNFAKIESQCLGVLGDRMILETGRFNKAGEVYLEAYSILTVNAEGKVTVVEAFADPQLSSLTEQAAKKE